MCHFMYFRDYVRWNFQNVAAQEDFGTCETDVLISLIQLDDLVIYDEMTLFLCLVRWIESQEDHTENLIRQVFAYVRFPMMSPRQLADLLLCSLTQRYKDFFVERMAIAMAFHSGESVYSVIHICFLTLIFFRSKGAFYRRFIDAEQSRFAAVYTAALHVGKMGYTTVTGKLLFATILSYAHFGSLFTSFLC